MSTESEELTESIAEALQASFNEAETDTESVEAEAAQGDSEAELVAETVDGEDTPIEENEVAVEAEEDTQDAEPARVFQAPEHWSSEHKEQFAALDPSSQELVLARDADFQTGYQERVQGITDIQSALEPWKQTIAELGLSEADAIRTLFATYNTLRTDPLSGIQNLAQNFGVLDQLNVPETDDDYTDPGVKALQSQIAGLQQQLQEVGNYQQQAVRSEGQRMIDNFKSEKTADGKEAHPYFEDALPLITSLVSQGKSLEEAYSEAVWTVPAYREASTPKAGLTAEQKAAKVKQARKASNTVKTSRSDSPGSQEKVMSLEDELTAAFREATQ